MTTKQTFRIEEIQTRADLQIRVQTDRETVERYQAAYLDGEHFPPISLVRHQGEILLVDGHHRLKAAIAAGLTEIEGEIVAEGDDYGMFVQEAVRANAKNGLSMTNRDRQRAAELLIQTNTELSLRAIAKDVGLSKSSIENYVRRLVNNRTLVKCKFCSAYTTMNGHEEKGWEHQGFDTNTSTFYCPKCAPKKDYLKLKADCDFHTQYLHKCTNCGMTAEAEIYMTDETIQIVCSCGIKSGKYKRAYDAVHTWNRMNPKIESETASKYPADEEPDTVSEFPADEEPDAVSEFPADEESDAVSKSEEPDDEEQDDEELDDEELELKKLEIEEKLLEHPCPKCGKSPMVSIFHSGRTQIKCPDSDCFFSGMATIYPTAENAAEEWIERTTAFRGLKDALRRKDESQPAVKLKKSPRPKTAEKEEEDSAAAEMRARVKAHPCPFCGSVPELFYYPENDGCWIECRNEDCAANPVVMAAEPEEAFNLWSRRHPQPESIPEPLQKFLKNGYRWTLSHGEHIQIQLGRHEQFDVLLVQFGADANPQRHALALPVGWRNT